MGLNTSLKPIFGLKTAMHGSENLDSFLATVEITLIKEAFRRLNFGQPNRKTRYIQEIIHNMKNSKTVCVPTEKNKSTCLVFVTNYQIWVNDHILKAYDLTLHPTVIDLFEESNQLIDRVNI